MSGATNRGLPYPDPNDPLTAGADAIKALAEAVDTKMMAPFHGVPGQLVIGVFDAGKPVVAWTFGVSTGGDPNGVVIVPLPGGTTCVLSATGMTHVATPGSFLQLDFANSNVGRVVFNAKSGAGGGPATYGLTAVGVIWLQSTFAGTTRPADPDEPEATPL